MEAVVVVLRPKLHVRVSKDFSAKAYDILLIDSQSSMPGKTQRQLPITSILCDDEQVDALCNFVYVITGEEFGGLKGKRAVFIPPSPSEPVSDQETVVKGALYCVPIDSKDKLNSPFVENLSGSPGFYSLDLVLERLSETNPVAFSKQTRVMLLRLESWLREKHSLPGAINLLFSVCTEDRLKRSLTNPAYLNDSQSGLSSSHLEDEFSRTVANEALAKMMAIEKCDLTIINPLVNTDISYKPKVDAMAINKYWGLGKPEYSKIKSCGHSKSPNLVNGDYNWMEEFPLHKCAHIGDAEGIRELIKKGLSVSEKDRESWAPIHYTAWFGHLEAITVLLNEGECSPNIVNNCGSTPLHLAATQGHVYVIELLLNHQEIDVNALDINNKTALNLCENVDRPDSQACAKLLRAALRKPPPVIRISLMDGTYRSLNLLSGANTTVQQLHVQMMEALLGCEIRDDAIISFEKILAMLISVISELNLPDSCSHLFTVWICSRNLQLQLKPDHKPKQHLYDWKRKIVAMLTTFDPLQEEPHLIWKRDAILSTVDERKVKHPVAINLLYHEAYHHYINSMYPCAEQDAIILAGILMQMKQGDYDARKVKNYLTSTTLATLIPRTKLQSSKKMDWISKIQAQYKAYSQSLTNRDRSPQVIQHHFLQICWNLTVYGSAFFTGEIQMKTSRVPTPVFIGVNDIGVHVINASTKVMLQSFNYKDIEWSYKDQAILEIKPSTKGGMHLFTKQATIVFYLVRTLRHLKEEKHKSEELKRQIQCHNAVTRQQKALKNRQQNRDGPRDNMPDASIESETEAVNQVNANVISGQDRLVASATPDTENTIPRHADGYFLLSGNAMTAADDVAGDC